MNRRPAKTTVGLAGIAVGLAVTGTVLAPAVAQAQVKMQRIGMDCWGLNPNVIDFPFYGGATAIWNSTKPDTFRLSGDSKSFFPYVSDTTVRVTNLSTNTTRSYVRRWQHTIGDNSGYFIDNIPAHGRTRITITTLNRGLLTIPGPMCSGVITI